MHDMVVFGAGTTDDHTYLLFGRVEASVPMPPPRLCILHSRGEKREDATPTPMDERPIDKVILTPTLTWSSYWSSDLRPFLVQLFQVQAIHSGEFVPAINLQLFASIF